MLVPRAEHAALATAAVLARRWARDHPVRRFGRHPVDRGNNGATHLLSFPLLVRSPVRPLAAPLAAPLSTRPSLAPRSWPVRMADAPAPSAARVALSPRSHVRPARLECSPSPPRRHPRGWSLNSDPPRPSLRSLSVAQARGLASRRPEQQKAEVREEQQAADSGVLCACGCRPGVPCGPHAQQFAEPRPFVYNPAAGPLKERYKCYSCTAWKAGQRCPRWCVRARNGSPPPFDPHKQNKKTRLALPASETSWIHTNKTKNASGARRAGSSLPLPPERCVCGALLAPHPLRPRRRPSCAACA